MKSSSSPIRFLKRAADLYPDQTAIVCGEERFTYKEYFERANRLGNALLNLGIQRKDRVAFLGYNCHCLLEAYYGVVQIGAVLMPMNIRLGSEDFLFMLNHAEAKAIIVQNDFLPLIDNIRDRLETVEIFVSAAPNKVDGYLDYEDVLQDASPEYYIDAEMQENDVAEIFYTSGTTGKPKGVMLSHRNLFANALNFIISLELKSTDVLIHTIPLFHVNGWGTPHSITYLGGTHVIIPKFEPELFFQLVEKEKVTISCMVPTMVTSLINASQISNFDLSSLKKMVVGGAASHPSLLEQVEEKMPGCTYIGSYGQTEATPVITNSTLKTHLLDRDPAERHLWQVKAGLPMPGLELRVVDENGNEILHNGEDTGEVIVRGETVMLGYWRDPEATAAAIRDGWLHTGDVATVDSEGYIKIVDRKKDIIISGGENISSIEVETAIYAHPSVLEAAVVGYPDDQWGEIVKAFVVLKPGASPVPADELFAFCRERIARFKVPRIVEYIGALPKSGTGKIMKQVLKQRG
ncbi:MAG: long-chain-fatty-acid--CoA ligase [Thermincola sp.]|jgi:fatty-acyl-CoA synthase|nr:long-chain-fatty-acid--CoA ligase [Thermincola sp.]MDT3702813.1 long-chain-fatty-acid--CoA ligase [Thermincola sp.]